MFFPFNSIKFHNFQSGHLPSAALLVHLWLSHTWHIATHFRAAAKLGPNRQGQLLKEYEKREDGTSSKYLMDDELH